MIANLLEKFGEKVQGLSNYKTPGTPGSHIVRPLEDKEKISSEDQALFRSGVGMLLYLVKHSRPDIANPVRELSKVLDGASPGNFREMLRVIKYVLDTRKFGLKIEPIFMKDSPWELVLFCDSDYAGDPD